VAHVSHLHLVRDAAEGVDGPVSNSNGGLLLAVADTQYTFNETMTFGNGLVANNAGSSLGAELRAGGYLEGKLLYAVTPDTSLFAGAQYENLGTFTRTAGSEQAQLDMGSEVHVVFGVQFSF
jgi:hypothetical protein